tara:strand:+ start:2792 stop:4666 length:1875 start_codon:yes stop_codon:yes gene_type:complete
MKLFQRLRYQIDKSLSRSFLSVIYILFILVFSVVLIITTIDFHSFEQSNGFIERFFDFFFASLIGESNDPNSSIINILINTTIAITGLFFSSVVIGLIVNIISDRIDEIRQGKSSIQESDHQLILGWSSGISLVMRELLLANENKTNASIVILDEMNPVEANEKIQHMFSEKKDYQKIVPKKGATYNRKHLNHVNLNAAKSIIINHNDDMKTIKTLAAIVNNPDRKEEKYNIVSKLNKKENYDLAKIIGSDEAQVLYFGDMLARIDAQTCLQTGLANVYLELVNFDGDEIYFHREKSLIGLSYGEAVISYDSSSIIGIERNSMILINPSFDEIIEANDNLIAISEDDDTVIKNGKSHTNLDMTKIVNTKVKTKKVETVFIFGSAFDGLDKISVVCSHLIKYLDNGSKINLVNDNSKTLDLIEKLDLTKEIDINFINGDIKSREFLDTLDINDGDNVLIVSSFDGVNNIDDCDAETLFTLINLRDIEKKTNKNFLLTTELINSQNAEIFASDSDDDYLYSEDIVQSMLVQIAENPLLGKFFDYLSSPQGSEIYFRPITDYVDITEPIDFYTICKSAGEKGETAIGYQASKKKKLRSLNAGVNINPKKSQRRQFKLNDKIIVFSDN